MFSVAPVLPLVWNRTASIIPVVYAVRGGLRVSTNAVDVPVVSGVARWA